MKVIKNNTILQVIPRLFSFPQHSPQQITLSVIYKFSNKSKQYFEAEQTINYLSLRNNQRNYYQDET